MDNKKLKKIMTDLAAGHITKKEADSMLKLEKSEQDKPNSQIEASGHSNKDSKRKHTIKKEDKN